jgi:putative NIF3 family GTP cyclohydrolase 1 type 2
MIPLTEIATFLNEYFQVSRYSDDLNGIYRSSDRLINRLGLALDPTPGLEQWVQDYSLDAVWLHRPWKLQLTPYLKTIGVLAYHLPFDEKLTIGYNLLLAKALGISYDIMPFGQKEGRAIGMIGEIIPTHFDIFRTKVRNEFGGEEAAFIGKKPYIIRVAVVGALTKELILQAVQQSVDIYITGEMRPNTQEIAAMHGLSIIAVGHQRCEEYGIKLLYDILSQRWPSLKVCADNKVVCAHLPFSYSFSSQPYNKELIHPSYRLRKTTNGFICQARYWLWHRNLLKNDDSIDRSSS